jgi:hypothetical protein
MNRDELGRKKSLIILKFGTLPALAWTAEDKRTCGLHFNRLLAEHKIVSI